MIPCLTIHNPYAHLIANGQKDVENRTRPWKYRGPLLIHASAKAAADGSHRYGMVYGAIVAVVDMVDCVTSHNPLVTWQPGPWCYMLNNPRRLETPIPWKGRQGVWYPEAAFICGDVLRIHRPDEMHDRFVKLIPAKEKP